MNPHLEHAIRHWVQHAEGWMSEERALEMAQLILDNKPQVVVECGVFAGRSLIAQAMALKDNGFGKIYGIDPWKVECTLEGECEDNRNWWSKNVDLNKMHLLCMEAIWKYGLDEFAIPIRSASQNCHELFHNVDSLFIDGNHSEIASCRDVNNYLPLVRSGGTVIADDANWASTQKAMRIIDSQCELLKDGKDYRIYRKK